MSQCPYSVRNIRWGTKFGEQLKLEDSLWDALTDSYAGVAMAITAENLAVQHNITRKDVDAFALRSQRRWAEADKAGRFDSEVAPMELKGKKGVVVFAKDEHPKPATTEEALAKLPAIFKKDGVVTAGTASGISDGAASLILASEDAVKKHGLTPLARVVGWQACGVEPKIMGIGPVPAIQALLKHHKLTVADVDLFDINEAFAAQWLACAKELGLDHDKSNVNGGAIALGHPLGASGSRILASLTYELQRRKGRYAVGSACAGGGQGLAVLLERV
jgi:acetyl-CoA acyltransferase 2